jgi:hypothetical protein
VAAQPFTLGLPLSDNSQALTSLQPFTIKERRPLSLKDLLRTQENTEDIQYQSGYNQGMERVSVSDSRMDRAPILENLREPRVTGPSGTRHLEVPASNRLLSQPPNLSPGVIPIVVRHCEDANDLLYRHSGLHVPDLRDETETEPVNGPPSALDRRGGIWDLADGELRRLQPVGQDMTEGSSRRKDNKEGVLVMADIGEKQAAVSSLQSARESAEETSATSTEDWLEMCKVRKRETGREIGIRDRALSERGYPVDEVPAAWSAALKSVEQGKAHSTKKRTKHPKRVKDMMPSLLCGLAASWRWLS